MSFDINVNVTVDLKTESIFDFFKKIAGLTQASPEQLMAGVNQSVASAKRTPGLMNPAEEQPITYEEHLALTARAEVKQDVKQETKVKKTKPELTEAVESAKEIIKPVEAVKPVTPGQPDYANITKDDIRALATEMQAHQGFNIKNFLKDLGYPNISSIPAELYPEVYEKLKKEEVSF